MSCSVEYCYGKHKSLGFCSKHYQRFKKHGSTSDDFGRILSPRDRFLNIGWNTVDGCFIWKGTKNRDGYGLFKYQNQMRGAHRVSFEMFNGSIPEDTSVRHTCDNPPCVNPSHLLLGSQQDNVNDCISRGRRHNQSGESNNASKLDMKSANEIRSIYSKGVLTQQELANNFGVSQRLVSLIVRNELWVESIDLTSS